MKSIKDENNKINKLIISYLTESIDPGEMKFLMDWISKDDKNRDQFNLIRNIWIASERPLSSEDFEPDVSYQRLAMKMRDTGFFSTSGIFKVTRFYKWYHIAAAGIILFILGSFLTKVFLLPGNASLTSKCDTEISIPYGAKSRIILPDSSIIILNAGTTLKYGNDFNEKHRSVHMSGEAFFEVNSDRGRPFIVTTDRMTVKAYGTKFNVKAYKDDNCGSAVLVEGNIEVEVSGSGNRSESYKLKPNEKLVVMDGETGIEKLNDHKAEVVKRIVSKPLIVDYSSNIKTELFTSWKDEKWILEREPLEDLVPKLERRFNLKFRFDENELKKYLFTGTIRNETIDQILEALTLTAPLRYSIKNDSVILALDTDTKDQYLRITTKK